MPLTPCITLKLHAMPMLRKYLVACNCLPTATSIRRGFNFVSFLHKAGYSGSVAVTYEINPSPSEKEQVRLRQILDSKTGQLQVGQFEAERFEPKMFADLLEPRPIPGI